jgi:hypothetical protein
MRMIRFIYIALFTLLFLYPDSTEAQRRVRVPQGFGTLNETIRNDTTTGGVRIDPNTIYVLQRGGVYLLSGSIIVSNFNLNLEAEDGDGPRPFVQMGFLEGNPQIQETFQCSRNITLKSIHVTNYTELGSYIDRVIVLSAPNIRAEVTDCIIDRAGQTMFRIVGGGTKIYMRNSVVSRMGRPSNPDNGRVIDNRTVVVDSLVMENNTFYDVTSRIVREGGGTFKYLKMNQNTLVNSGQRLLSLGVISQFSFTNNIVINPRFLGNSSTDAVPAIEFTAGASPQIQIANNNFYYETEILQLWQQISQSAPPVVLTANQTYVSNTITEPLSLVNRPLPPVEIARQLVLFGQSSNVPDWDWTAVNVSRPWELDALGFHNFGYPSSSASYSASSTSEPLGDLRWHTGFEVTANLQALIKKALQSIAEYQNNPVIGFGTAELASLQSAISAAQSTASNAGSSRSQTGTAYSTLAAALAAFNASLLITEVDENKSNAIVFYPNPSRDFIVISPTIKSKQVKSIFITSADGRTVLSKFINESVNENIDIRNLEAGLYVVRLYTGNGTFLQQKLIKTP